jgi:triosephosphate isomerase (TIM)
MNCLKDDAFRLISALKSGNFGKHDIVLCPPFTLLSTVFELIKGTKFQLGAQNCHFEVSGAYTGEISATQIKDVGAKYVIVGHSEQRSRYKITDETVGKQALSAIKSGLIPIICIGESEQQRKAGKTQNIVEYQIENSVPKGQNGKYIIAYEPIWAIGTGVTPTKDEIKSVHSFISERQSGVKILYGGSVNDQNCKEISAIQNVSGFLVGGASIDPVKFTKIIEV